MNHFPLPQILSSFPGKSIMFDALVHSQITDKYHIELDIETSILHVTYKLGNNGDFDIYKGKPVLTGEEPWMKDILDITNLKIKTLGNEMKYKNVIPFECDICYKQAYLNFILPCKHQFCRLCVLEWARLNNTCPSCREPFFMQYKLF